MKTVKAKIKGTNAILEGCVCDDSFFVSVDHDIFERYALCEVEICKDSLQVPETCKENADSFTSLEEAADDYADKHGFRVPYDGSENYYDDVDVKASKEGFIAGAEWMRKKDVEDMYMSDNRHFLKCYEQGKVDMRVEMMKDAVEGEITVGRLPDDWSLAYNPDELHRALLKFKSGDKVKIIIVKQ